MKTYFSRPRNKNKDFIKWHKSGIINLDFLLIYLHSFSTGSTADVTSSNLPSYLIKRGPQTRQLQPLLYVTTTGAGGQRTRKHWRSSIDCLLSTPASALLKTFRDQVEGFFFYPNGRAVPWMKELEWKSYKNLFYAKNTPSFFVKTGDLPCQLLIFF